MTSKSMSMRVVIGPPSPAEKMREIRRKRYARLLRNRGIREASIEKYLIRGFSTHWARALHKELQRLIWDTKYRGGRRA